MDYPLANGHADAEAFGSHPKKAAITVFEEHPMAELSSQIVHNPIETGCHCV